MIIPHTSYSSCNSFLINSGGTFLLGRGTFLLGRDTILLGRGTFLDCLFPPECFLPTSPLFLPGCLFFFPPLNFFLLVFLLDLRLARLLPRLLPRLLTRLPFLNFKAFFSAFYSSFWLFSDERSVVSASYSCLVKEQRGYLATHPHQLCGVFLTSYLILHH